MDWIYGIHAVQTMLKSAPGRVRELHVQRGRQDDRLQKIHKLAEQHGVALQWATVKQLDKRAEGRHQGVMALPVVLAVVQAWWQWQLPVASVSGFG